MNQFVHTNGIRLHYLDHGGEGPTLILMPGLTANAYCFDGLVQAGLSEHFRVLALDLRGRGLSDKPDSGYRMEDHAQDVLGLIEALELDDIVLGGHSFGGLLSMYMAAQYPEAMRRLVVIDAAGEMHPKVRDLIQPSVARLGQTVPSWDVYLDGIKKLPFFEEGWDPAAESYYRADVETLEDGSVKPRSRPEAIIEAVEGALAEEWTDHLAAITKPLLLLNGTQGVGRGMDPVLPQEQALKTVTAVQDGFYQEVAGNHFTMLYGAGAEQITDAIVAFAQG